MHIVCSGKECLKSLVLHEVFINNPNKNLVVYTSLVGQNTMRNPPQLQVSNIKNGSFSLLSSTDCEVKWLVIEIDNNDNIRDYMSWHPMF